MNKRLTSAEYKLQLAIERKIADAEEEARWLARIGAAQTLPAVPRLPL